MDPSTDYEARMQADIARLQSAKGVNVRAWFRANKVLVIVFASYLALMGIYAAIAVANGDPPGAGILVGAFAGPIVMLRILLRVRRR